MVTAAGWPRSVTHSPTSDRSCALLNCCHTSIKSASRRARAEGLSQRHIVSGDCTLPTPKQGSRGSSANQWHAKGLVLSSCGRDDNTCFLLGSCALSVAEWIDISSTEQARIHLQISGRHLTRKSTCSSKACGQASLPCFEYASLM